MENETNDSYTLGQYQSDALASAVYPDQGGRAGLVYTILGLCGEAGELANKLKKHMRNETPINETVLADELGDVLWYVAAVSREINRDLGDLAFLNINKLNQRKEVGTIKDRENSELVQDFPKYHEAGFAGVIPNGVMDNLSSSLKRYR